MPIAVGLALLLLGVPVAVAIGLAASLALLLAHTSLIIVVQQLFGGLNSFVLLAIPFYMFTGAVMEAGGIAVRLIEVARALVGFLPGGLGMVDVVASLFFADLSGSATADTAAIGSVMIPGLRRAGYDGPFATALQSASGSLGLLFPPSISQIVFAYVAQVSTGKVFEAALLPGLLVAISFMIVNFIAARRHHLPRETGFSLGALGRAVWRAGLALLTPLIILGGIFSGVFTPTEAGVAAAVYVTLVAIFAYRSLTWGQLPALLAKTVVNTAKVTFLLGSALVLGVYLTRQQVPASVASLLAHLSHNTLLLLVLINLFLVLIHTMLETISSIIVVVPVLLPLMATLHVDPIHFGIILLINSAIGINLPPVGFCLYIATSISGVALEKAARAILPFIVALVVDLALVTLIPGMSLWLPGVSHP
jgi:C4-dicarboxylate transporter DctM subunit